MESKDFILLGLGLIVGVLFGCGVTDWHILLEYDSLTDWITALCTIAIVFGTFLAAQYAKKSADYAKRQFFAENIELANKLHQGVITELCNFSLYLDDFCEKCEKLSIQDMYQYSILIHNSQELLKKLNSLRKNLEQERNSIVFIMQDKTIFVSLAILSNLKNYLSQLSNENIDKTQQTENLSKTNKINTELKQQLTPIIKIFSNYYIQK